MQVLKDVRFNFKSGEVAESLSGGNQQKVIIGKWLARDSKVVIFVENAIIHGIEQKIGEGIATKIYKQEVII